MGKVDLSKEHPQLLKASDKEPAVVDIPKLQYLMVDGEGAPEQSKDFQPTIHVLYGIVYTLKFTRKKAGQEPDFKIMPLEGLWWMKDDREFDQSRPQDWRWTLMIAVPEFIGNTDVEQAKKQLSTKRPELPVDKLRLESFEEGRVVQTLHIGPYDKEGPTIEKMHRFASDNNLQLGGKHHEIYMGDPRRVPPEKIKTILRHPISV